MDLRPMAAAALLILAAVAGVQLADPRLGGEPDPPPEVDFSEPPAEVAADSAAQFSYIDYSYRLINAAEWDGEWRQVFRVEVDRSDREYYQVGPTGGRGTLIYGTESVSYVRPAAGTGWRVTPRLTYPPGSVAQPFLVDRLRSANATVIHENSSRLVVYVDVHPLTTVSRLPGNATLHIRKPDGRLVRADVVYNTEGDPKYFQFRFIDDGIDVTRPVGISVSVRGVLWDLLRGPVSTPFGYPLS